VAPWGCCLSPGGAVFDSLVVVWLLGGTVWSMGVLFGP
jgi:hypothetical protein